MRMDKIEVLGILADVKFRNWRFVVEEKSWDDRDVDGRRGLLTYLQVRFDDPDLVTGTLEEQSGRKWIISPHMTKSEVVTTAFKAVMTAMEHEVREQFRYRGRMIFGPHFDVDSLHSIATSKHRDLREDPKSVAND